MFMKDEDAFFEEVFSSSNARAARPAASSKSIAASVSGWKKKPPSSSSSRFFSPSPPAISASARAASARGNGTLAVPRAGSSANAEAVERSSDAYPRGYPRPPDAASRSAESGTAMSDRGSEKTHRGHVARRLSASAPNTRAACFSVKPTSEGLERPPRSSGTTETSRAEPPEREAATVVDSAPRSMPIENASADQRHASVAAANASDAERARAAPPRAPKRRIAARRARARTEATPRCARVVTTAASWSKTLRGRTSVI